MYPDILVQNQSELLPLVRTFSKEYYLAGGTAIALQIGHRRSIDFDLFTTGEIRRRSIHHSIQSCGFQVDRLLYEAFDQMHVMIHDTKITFFAFPFKINPTVAYEDVIAMPALIDLAAMKAHALGGRGKWKDYVDLYFLLKTYFTIDDIEMRSRELFKSMFNGKLFREQLAYFEDIDYSEEVEFVGKNVPAHTIKSFLIEKSAQSF
jgi:hypothetical protein